MPAGYADADSTGYVTDQQDDMTAAGRQQGNWCPMTMLEQLSKIEFDVLAAFANKCGCTDQITTGSSCLAVRAAGTATRKRNQTAALLNRES